MDYILNGQGFGSTAAALLASNFDPRVLRPYIGPDGRAYYDLTTNQRDKEGRNIVKPTLQTNATATLLKDEWKILDATVQRVKKERLRVWNDLKAAGLGRTIPNGMGKTVIESQTMGDVSPALISMDPANQSEADRPEFGIMGIPLPVVHADFHFTLRQIAVSRNGGAPLDTTMVELKTRRCIEEIEKLTLGVSSSYTYAGYTVYGMRNHPNRITKSITAPTTPGWTPDVLVGELLAARQLLVNARFYGPYGCYISGAWEQYLDDDYSAAKGDNTLRERLAKVGSIGEPMVSDFLTGWEIIIYQKTSDVIKAITGMDLTTLQWETQGGMIQNFKILGIMVPQIQADANGNAGIVHCS